MSNLQFLDLYTPFPRHQQVYLLCCTRSLAVVLSLWWRDHVCVYIFGFKGALTSKVIGARNEMMMDDYDGQMIFGDLVGLKLPDIRLAGEEKPRKNLTQETCPDRGSNPGPLRDKRACYHLFHSGGLCEEIMIAWTQIGWVRWMFQNLPLPAAQEVHDNSSVTSCIVMKNDGVLYHQVSSFSPESMRLRSLRQSERTTAREPVPH